MKFADLGLIEPLLRALAEEKYETATPIQVRAIPVVLEGKDVLGSAQTGTGKTAAFALPILQRMSKQPPGRAARCLVLAPTRELATQIAEGFRAYGRHVSARTVTIFGGVSQNHQVAQMRRGVDVIVATPGRLLDLYEQRLVDFRSIETFVLDEADRMLDMGFIDPIRKIASMVPEKRQTLMFSATMPTEIRRLADALLKNPVRVEAPNVKSAEPKIEETVYFVDKPKKSALLAHLFEHLSMARTIVFTRTKHGADKVVRHLHRYGIRAEAIHGNKSQNQRQRALDNFKAGKTPMLVATDIASRGIDVDMVTHVVNYDLTHEPETYVHRIGRTGRAGQTGVAVSFCDHEEKSSLKAIEKLLKRAIPVEYDMPKLEAAPKHELDHEERDGPQRGGRRERRPSRDEGRPARPYAPRSHEPREQHRSERPREERPREERPREERAHHSPRPSQGEHRPSRPTQSEHRPTAKPHASKPAGARPAAPRPYAAKAHAPKAHGAARPGAARPGARPHAGKPSARPHPMAKKSKHGRR